MLAIEAQDPEDGGGHWGLERSVHELRGVSQRAGGGHRAAGITARTFASARVRAPMFHRPAIFTIGRAQRATSGQKGIGSVRCA